MWYRLDLLRFAWQMLPPMLRSTFLQAIIRALFVPLLWLYDRFSMLRSHADIRLLSNGQAIAITDALRREFDAYEGDIYITDIRNNAIYFRLVAESKSTAQMYLQREATAQYFAYSDEGNWEADFYVHVPSYLRGNEDDIKTIIEHYKPAGRRYLIKFYEYE